VVSLREPGSLLFGIVTYAGSQSAEEDARSLGSALSSRLGKPLSVLHFADESALAGALATGKVDAAWMPPLALKEAKSQGDVTPVTKLVRQGKEYYRSAIFARADRGITSLAQLKGTKMAWVDKRSASGYRFPLELLLDAHMDPQDLFSSQSFEGDHAAVCRAVFGGKADVGATFIDDRPEGVSSLVDGCSQVLGPESATSLVVVAVTKPIPNDVVAARPGLPADVLQSLKTMLLGLSDDNDGKAILVTVFKADSFTDVHPGELGFIAP
jgi:phosphonate transport system substrate-binding protein